MDKDTYDVVVIGGGAAGLSGAVTLARARRSVLVVDAGQPRNAPAAQVHAFLGNEGISPARLLAAGREEVVGYGGELVTGTVTELSRQGDGFLVSLADGRFVSARRLLLTTGLVDELPAIPGLASLWGRDVLHCPYCHGWEVRDQAIGVLATSPLAMHQALLWRQWSENVTLFLHTGLELEESQWEELAARGIAVVEGEVTDVVVAGGRLAAVRLAGGREIDRDALVVGTRMTGRGGLLATLGLEVAEQVMNGHVVGTYVPADPTGKTSVPGVWVAGNLANPTDQVIAAAAAGTRAGAMINFDLVTADTAAAVAARRTPAPA